MSVDQYLMLNIVKHWNIELENVCNYLRIMSLNTMKTNRHKLLWHILSD